MNLVTAEDLSYPTEDGLISFFSETFAGNDYAFLASFVVTKSLPLLDHPEVNESSTSNTASQGATFYTYSTSTMASTGCQRVSYDVSHLLYPGTPQQMPMWEVVIKCAVVVMLTLVAIVGNVLIIAIVIVSKKMRTTTNLYIVNLAIADLIVACIPMWIYVTTNVTDGWILGSFLCKFNAFVQACAMCTISFTMMAIAGDRFIAIVFPLKARVTQRKVKVVVAVIWVCGISIGIPLLLYYTYTERKWLNYIETFCSDVWPTVVLPDGKCDGGKRAEQAYWTVVVAVLNWIPMLMMTIIYMIIIQRLQFGRVTHNGSDSMSAVQRRSTKRVVKMLFILLITFMVCTIPFQVTTIFDAYKERITLLPYWYQPVYFSAINLMYAHSAINPIVYGAMNQTFRSGFRHLVDRFRPSPKNASWNSHYSTNNTAIRPNICVINKGELDCSIATSLTDLAKSSSHLNLAVLKNGDGHRAA